MFVNQKVEVTIFQGKTARPSESLGQSGSPAEKTLNSFVFRIMLPFVSRLKGLPVCPGVIIPITGC
jgi:hypothetical protein